MTRRLGLVIWAATFCVAAITLAVETSATKFDPSWVDSRVEAWQPTESERAFDQIAWAKDLTEAERLAKKHGRPIFLFTYDGTDLACYRC